MKSEELHLVGSTLIFCSRLRPMQHSKQLTLIHEELEPQLKRIRQHLNSLALERKQPKIKKLSRHCHLKSDQSPLMSDVGKHCLGGKTALKTHFMLHVGDADALYKTRKLTCLRTKIPTLDLHGFKNAEALDELNERLPTWIDTAMKGSYPWVIKVKVITGAGSQTLSDAVSKWIKENKNVANAPKLAYD